MTLNSLHFRVIPLHFSNLLILESSHCIFTRMINMSPMQKTISSIKSTPITILFLILKAPSRISALEAMPYTQMQPKAFIEGQKGCGGCHTLGLTDASMRETKGRKYYRYGMDCQNCHTRHAFSRAEAAEPEAAEPEACMTCHMGLTTPSGRCGLDQNMVSPI
jgi:hypothetical protein